MTNVYIETPNFVKKIFLTNFFVIIKEQAGEEVVSKRTTPFLSTTESFFGEHNFSPFLSFVAPSSYIFA
jgi:hypothetical protein